MSRTIERSLDLYNRAVKVIPGGAQTLSKQYGRMIQGISPPMIEYGEGCKVWDYDDNEYIDWTASLGPIVLGYEYFDIGIFYRDYDPPDQVLLPMTNHLEVELAEKLVDIIPSAEMVRFFKSGSDATSAAVRLSRAIKNKSNVICSGYHGWSDWYACTLPEPRRKGTLYSTDYWNTFKINYGDLIELEYRFSSEKIACFILEPMNRQCPEKASRDYLIGVRKLCDKYGVILIFDEMIMGFRYAMAGGEEYFGVTPDLSCYGKAIANGFPLAALTGKRELMKEIEHLQVSGTNFGELLSIKAALETIKIIEKENVIDYLWFIGNRLSYDIKRLISNYNIGELVYLKGFGPWHSLVWADGASIQQNYFLQEMAKGGILYNRDFFSMLSHTDEDVKKTISVIERIFDTISGGGDLVLEGGAVNTDLFPR
uniref:Putative aminotransferase n=1 Tax=viral metagenome TaxID=1070528 RepID=A0A6M3L5C4_9ZZZZ